MTGRTECEWRGGRGRESEFGIKYETDTCVDDDDDGAVRMMMMIARRGVAQRNQAKASKGKRERQRRQDTTIVNNKHHHQHINNSTLHTIYTIQYNMFIAMCRVDSIKVEDLLGELK